MESAQPDVPRDGSVEDLPRALLLLKGHLLLLQLAAVGEQLREARG